MHSEHRIQFDWHAAYRRHGVMHAHFPILSTGRIPPRTLFRSISRVQYVNFTARLLTAEDSTNVLRFTMPLQLSLVTDDADFYKFAPLMFEAIQPNGFVTACWPRNLVPEAQSLHAGGFIAHKLFDPTVKWTKITDTETGEIIGVAQWLVIKDEKPPEFDFDGSPSTGKDEGEKLYAQDIYRPSVSHRRNVLRNESLPVVGQ